MPCASRAIATDESVNGWLQMIAGLVTLDALNGMIEEYGAAPNQPDCSLDSNGRTTCCDGLKLGGLLSELVIRRRPVPVLMLMPMTTLSSCSASA